MPNNWTLPKIGPQTVCKLQIIIEITILKGLISKKT